MRAAAALVWVAALAAQEPGTIRGVVRDALSGTAMPGVTVTGGGASTRTDASGGFSLRNVAPGEVRVDVAGESVSSLGPKRVTVSAGQDIVLDLPVQGLGRIAGVVVDGDGKPITDATVTVVTREYWSGTTRYGIWFSTITNARGEFGAASPLAMSGGQTITLRMPMLKAPGFSLESGRSYLLLATKGRASGALGIDPEARPRIAYPMWYIGSRTAAGAIPLMLAPGERREGLTIRMESGANYCIHGTVRPGLLHGGSVRMTLADAPVETQGILGYLTYGGPLDAVSETGLRFCNLAPGDYRITSSIADGSNAFPWFFRTQVVTITDHDAHISLDGTPPVRLRGEIVWVGDEFGASLQLDISPIHHTVAGETLTLKSAGAFAFEKLVADQYELQVRGIPSNAYLKDVTSRGRSLLHRPISAGSADELRIVLATDGGRITAQAPAEAWVVAVPSAAANEIAVADTMVSGRADASGVWTSPMLAPGKYLVMTSAAPVDRSVDAVERVWRGRGQAREAEVTSGANVTVRLKER